MHWGSVQLLVCLAPGVSAFCVFLLMVSVVCGVGRSNACAIFVQVPKELQAKLGGDGAVRERAMQGIVEFLRERWSAHLVILRGGASHVMSCHAHTCEH